MSIERDVRRKKCQESEMINIQTFQEKKHQEKGTSIKRSGE
jgi:hypothetical protein